MSGKRNVSACRGLESANALYSFEVFLREGFLTRERTSFARLFLNVFFY